MPRPSQSLGERADDDRHHHAERTRHEGQNGNRRDGDAGALPIGAEGARHAPDGLLDDGHGHDLEAMQRARAEGAGDRGSRHREDNDDEC